MVRATALSSAFWRALSTRTWIESATKRSPSSPAEAVTRLTLKSCQRTSSSDMRRVEDSGGRELARSDERGLVARKALPIRRRIDVVEARDTVGDLEHGHVGVACEDLTRPRVSAKLADLLPEIAVQQGRRRSSAVLHTHDGGRTRRALCGDERIEERRGHVRLITQHHNGGIARVERTQADLQRAGLTRGVIGVAHQPRTADTHAGRYGVRVGTEDEDDR